MTKQDKVIKDGKVAVIHTNGYGAGWYSWNQGAENAEALLFDPVLVRVVQGIADCMDGVVRFKYHAEKKIKERAEELVPGACVLGAPKLCITWVPVCSKFIIREYDGLESVELRDDVMWVTA